MSNPLQRTLDYVPRLVDANNRYLVRDHLPEVQDIETLWETPVWWQGGPVLDQGQEGSCVGHGVTGEYLASPVRGRLANGDRSQKGHELAVKVYNRAKEIDEWEGVDYDGTSVRAGLLVAREWKWIGGFLWMKNMDEFRRGLQDGPIVIGFRVMTSTFYPRDGILDMVSGVEEGWHCVVATGYSPAYGKHGRRIRLRQSWGREHGKAGNVYADPDELNENMFAVGGEAGLPTGRALAPVV